MNPGDAIDLAQEMSLHLKDQHPATTGAALAQLLAIWLASHPRPARDHLLDLHIASVRRLVPVVLKESGVNDC